MTDDYDPANELDQSAIREERAANKEERSALKEERGALKEERNALREERSSARHQQMVLDEASRLAHQRTEDRSEQAAQRSADKVEHEGVRVADKTEVLAYVDKHVRDRFAFVDRSLANLQKQLVKRWLIAILGLLLMGGGFTYSLYQASHNATVARNSATLAQTTAINVARARYETILNACLSQNRRNVNTQRQLNREIEAYIKQHKLTGAAAQVIRTSAHGTVLLINTLAPVQNCPHVVATETSTHQ